MTSIHGPSEDLLIAAIKQSPVAIFVLSGDGLIVAAEGAILGELNLSKSDLIGQQASKIRNFPVTKSHLKRAQNGESFSANINVNGLMYETSYYPKMDDSKSMTTCYCLSQNVTDRILAEEVLDQNRYKAARMQQLNSLAEMANGIAHEINNPLTIISGYSEQIIRELSKTKHLSSDFLAPRCRALINTANRITLIIKGLQAFSRVGNQDPIERTSVKEIFSEAFEIIRSRLVKKGIKLVSEPIPEDLYFYVRKAQITQVIFNLIANAIEALESSSDPMLIVSVRASTKDISIRISDNGPGIPISHKNKVWEPFFTSKDLSHPGIGLSSAKGIIESHLGMIEHERSNNLTNFCLRIPIGPN